ncbi:FKBP65 [Symbiodinium sp. CCMP2456]|nr:FKBP65 [Symbiodinium sp. CCMP2456]
MEGGFAKALGVWSSQPGSCYQVWLDDMHQMIYEERQNDGKEVRGMLLIDDIWMVGRLLFRNTGDVFGTLRLRYIEESDCLVSYFQRAGSDEWVQAVSSRCLAKADAPLNELKTVSNRTSRARSSPHMLELPKDGDLPWNGEDSMLQVYQHDGLSPLLRDCVLHSLKARIKYLENAMMHDKESPRPLEIGWRASPAQMVPASGNEAQEARPRQKLGQRQRRFARTVWHEIEDADVDAAQQKRPKSIDTGAGAGAVARSETKDQGVQCDAQAQVETQEPQIPDETSQWKEEASPKRNAHLQAVLERQQRRCLVLAEDVALLTEELLELQAKPLTATSLWVSPE